MKRSSLFPYWGPLAIRVSEAQRREALIPLGALSTSKKLCHFCAEYIYFFRY